MGLPCLPTGTVIQQRIVGKTTRTLSLHPVEGGKELPKNRQKGLTFLFLNGWTSCFSAVRCVGSFYFSSVGTPPSACLPDMSVRVVLVIDNRAVSPRARHIPG